MPVTGAATSAAATCEAVRQFNINTGSGNRKIQGCGFHVLCYIRLHDLTLYYISITAIGEETKILLAGIEPEISDFYYQIC